MCICVLDHDSTLTVDSYIMVREIRVNKTGPKTRKE